MANLPARVRDRVVKAAGSSFWVKFLVTSSDITTSEQALSTAASGDLMVTHVIAETDATGLAGGTNFQIGVTCETYGTNLMIVGTVALLGASKILIAPENSTAADTTTDTHFTVQSSVPFLLEAGDSLHFSNTAAVGTGAGVIAILIRFERLEDGATIASAV